MGSTPIYSIPFADPTDLVRDWPALSEDVAEAVEAAVAGVPVLAGIGSNVVHASKTAVQTTSSSTFVNVTDLDVTITPSSTSSKILVIATVMGGNGSNNFSHYAVFNVSRNTTQIAQMTEISGADVPSAQAFGSTISVLDDPNTTSAVTYRVRFRAKGGTAQINRNRNHTGAYESSIVAIEVAS